MPTSLPPLRRARSVVIGVLVVLTPLAAHAQPRPKPREPEPADVAMPLAPHVEEKLVTAVPGGLTAEASAKRALATSFVIKAALDTAESAAALVDKATIGYSPNLVLSASYTRLSTVTPPVDNSSRSVVTTAPAGTVNPPIVAVANRGFNVLFDYYALQANLTVPISDYFVKLNHEHRAAVFTEEGARLDAIAQRSKVAVSTKIAFYEWLRARGAMGVADQTLAGARAHVDDAKIKFGAGAVPGADVLRAEAAVAAAELFIEKGKANGIAAEWTLRTLMHAPGDEKLETGESFDTMPPPLAADLPALLKEAAALRVEWRVFDRSAEAARKLASAARSARYPTLNGVASLDYSNPSSRKFPATAEFFPSWSVGATLKWSPRDALTAGASGSDLDAKAASLEALRESAQDGVVKEVVAAYTAARAADAAVVATTRQLDAEREAYRVSRQLYTAGRTTGTALLDAQYALAQVRLDNLNARADVLVSRVNLEHQVGRDLRGLAATR